MDYGDVHHRAIVHAKKKGISNSLNLELLCPAGAKIAQRIASWTWDVTHERALSTADLFGGKAPVGALIGLLERIR